MQPKRTFSVLVCGWKRSSVMSKPMLLIQCQRNTIYLQQVVTITMYLHLEAWKELELWNIAWRLCRVHGGWLRCNIINSDVASELRQRGVIFDKSNRKIHPYVYPPIVARQQAKLMVQVPCQSSINAEFRVIPGYSPALLVKQTAEALGRYSIWWRDPCLPWQIQYNWRIYIIVSWYM